MYKIILSFFLVVLLLSPTIEAFAQTQTNPKQSEISGLAEEKIPPNRLIRPPKNIDFWQHPILWSQQQQAQMMRMMNKALDTLKSQAPFDAALTLILLSLAYGIFHAAGPGHGKAVISAWLFAGSHELRRGILIAFMAALVQALSAVIIVSVLLLMVRSVAETAPLIVKSAAAVSYGLICLLGLYMICSAFAAARLFQRLASGLRSTARRLFQRLAPGSPRPLDIHSSASLRGPPDRSACALGFPPTALGSSGSGVPPTAHDHSHHCACGHNHMPESAQLQGSWSWQQAIWMAFAVGIRPCTGAFAILIAANAYGIYWAGIVSSFVMAFGTFLTVSLIAACTVYARGLMMRWAKHGEAPWLSLLVFALRLTAGILLFVIGGFLFFMLTQGQEAGYS